MNKPPAFQFYADDFIGGTVDLDAEQVGAYIRLLCYQWNKGAIPDGTAIVNRIAGCEVCNEVLSKFPNGRNPRMEAVRAELEAFRAKQSSNGASGAKKRWRCHDLANGQTIAKAWPNDSSPSPSPIEINKEGAPKLDEVLAFGQMRGLSKSDCEQFWHHFESTGWIDKNGHPIKKWQSKLMTWKANAPQTPPFAPGSVAATKPRQPFKIGRAHV